MSHNIPLMRRVYEQITQHPDRHDQGKWRRCVAGWAIELHGEYGFLRDSGVRDCFQVIDFRTGKVEDTEDVAARILGLMAEEASGLFASNNRDVVAWLEDILVAHDMREFDLIAAGFTEDDWPIGEVTA
ncbi:hypothetical protein [Nocardia niwae]|uniref:hypothetical protein n=1 Tax=Nocardia niwae TaxID=626084 RepID=UPI0007A3755C|nr:hypothetical protein [Nocardia niwae]